MTDHSRREGLKGWLEGWVMAPASDTLAAMFRAEYHLPRAASADDVKVITDSGICVKVRMALAAIFGNVQADSLSVAVVQLDSLYLAYDPQSRFMAGEWATVFVLDGQYRDLGHISY